MDCPCGGGAAAGVGESAWDWISVSGRGRNNCPECFNVCGLSGQRPHHLPALNQIALRHVDSVAALEDDRRLILSKAIQKTDLRFAATFIDVLNKGAVLIQNEDDLIALLPSPTAKEAEKQIGSTDSDDVEPADAVGRARRLTTANPVQ